MFPYEFKRLDAANIECRTCRRYLWLLDGAIVVLSGHDDKPPLSGEGDNERVGTGSPSTGVNQPWKPFEHFDYASLLLIIEIAE